MGCPHQLQVVFKKLTGSFIVRCSCVTDTHVETGHHLLLWIHLVEKGVVEEPGLFVLGDKNKSANLITDGLWFCSLPGGRFILALEIESFCAQESPLENHNKSQH